MYIWPVQETSFHFSSENWFTSGNPSGNLSVPSGFPWLTRHDNGGGNVRLNYVHGDRRLAKILAVARWVQTRTQLPGNFRFTSGLLLANAKARQPLDRWCHWTLDRIFSIFVWFLICISMIYHFSLRLRPVKLPKSFQAGTSGKRTSVKSKKKNFR